MDRWVNRCWRLRGFKSNHSVFFFLSSPLLLVTVKSSLDPIPQKKRVIFNLHWHHWNWSCLFFLVPTAPLVSRLHNRSTLHVYFVLTAVDLWKEFVFSEFGSWWDFAACARGICGRPAWLFTHRRFSHPCRGYQTCSRARSLKICKRPIGSSRTWSRRCVRVHIKCSDFSVCVLIRPKLGLAFISRNWKPIGSISQPLSQNHTGLHWHSSFMRSIYATQPLLSCHRTKWEHRKWQNRKAHWRQSTTVWNSSMRCSHTSAHKGLHGRGQGAYQGSFFCWWALNNLLKLIQ